MTASMVKETSPEQTYSISELCQEFKVTPRALRFYEQKGLVAPARRGWTRIYDQRDRTRLKLIVCGKCFGFSLVEIKEMLDLYDLDNGQVTQLRVVFSKLKGRLQELRAERNELIDAIADLERTCDMVDDMLQERLAEK